MSKIGKLPVQIPEGVEVNIDGRKIRVTGPKGTLEREVPEELSVEIRDGKLWVLLKKKTNHARALYGTTRSLIVNMVHGVSQGWSKTLQLVGTGYKAELSGKTLVLSVGYSHPIKIDPPQEINFKVEKSDVIVEGIDKELVGLVAAKIRAVRPPEPYKGKGILYKGEEVRRKAGKAAKAVGASG